MLLLTNSCIVLIAYDFNARTTNWWKNNLFMSEGNQVDLLTTFCSVILDSTHIFPNSSSSVDLIFTRKPNLVVESGVHVSLNPKNYYQVIFANLKLEYRHLYWCLIWDCKNADTLLALIRPALS